MSPRICAVIIVLAIGIIALELVNLFYSATHDHRQSAIIEEAINNTIFYESETNTQEDRQD